MKALQEIMFPFFKNIVLPKKNKLFGKKILITGATGLIGSNIIAYLDYLNKKNSLKIKITAIHKTKLEAWMTKTKTVKYVKIDLSKKDVKKAHYDYIIHCATYAQPKKFLQFPKETILLNIKTLFNLLELAQSTKASFMYLSSAEIYGQADSAHIPTDESYFGNVNTLTDRAVYAESKRLAETICYQYMKHLPIKIARLLICYGPGVKQNDQRVYSEFIKKSLQDKQIIMMDSGAAQRTLCFVSDAVEMLLNIFLNGKSTVYNVCGNETVSIKNLADLIARINSSIVSSDIQFKEIKGTPARSTLSNKRYLDEFNKKKFVTLEEGMTATSQWFSNLL